MGAWLVNGISGAKIQYPIIAVNVWTERLLTATSHESQGVAMHGMDFGHMIASYGDRSEQDTVNNRNPV